MEDILKIVKYLKDSEILLKGVSETIKNEASEQRGGFRSMLLGTLGASLLGSMLAGKGVIRGGEGTARVGNRPKRSSFKKEFLIPPHPLINFEIKKFLNNKNIIANIFLDDFVLDLLILYPKEIA